MANPAALRNGLATRLKTIVGLKAVYARWPSQFDYPCAVVGRGAADPEQTFGRGDLTNWRFSVTFLTTLAPGYEDAQDRLNPFIATSSTGGLYGAIHADRTLGGIAAGTFIKSLGEDDQLDLQADLSVLAYVAELEVWSS